MNRGEPCRKVKVIGTKGKRMRRIKVEVKESEHVKEGEQVKEGEKVNREEQRRVVNVMGRRG